MLALARIARPLTVWGPIVAVIAGLIAGSNDLALALCAPVAVLFLLRGGLVLGSERIRASLAAENVYWLGEQYLTPTRAGGVQALIFGTWVGAAATWGLVGLL